MKRLPCPSSYRPEESELSTLLAIVGRAKLAKLQEAFGGKRIWIPKPGTAMPCHSCQERDECIKSWRKAGHTVPAIADRLGISVKTVYRILRQDVPAPAVPA